MVSGPGSPTTKTAGRRRRRVAFMAAALLTACSTGSGASTEERPTPTRHALALVQMNLCLSGIATCAGRDDHAAAVAEGIALTRENDADLVVVTEACSGDAERIASAAGLHVTFFTVRIFGSALPCVDPGGRGMFGNAVLTSAPPLAVRDRPYNRQSDEEERRVVCAQTENLWVCGTHLSVRGYGFGPVNDAQCTELAGFLVRLSRIRPTLVAGDMNRRESCAPSGWWSESDGQALQLPGVQHVYGDGRLDPHAVEVHPMSHTDHDALVVRFSVSRGPE
jgi:endonuclease/exonuclease/phosphatase (EEP) superfamily protein YafD